MATKYKLIQSLSRAFSIINCFSEQEKELTLSEISKRVELNINTTRGLVQTLLHYHYLAYDSATHLYRLGKIYLEKAEIAQFDITEQAIQLVKNDLQELADKYTISGRLISINDLNTSTVLERRPSRSRYILMIHNQSDFPLYASATGKLILAYLDEESFNQVIENIRWIRYGKNTIMDPEQLRINIQEVKEKNVSFEADELGDGYSSIALPVLLNNELVFTLSVVSTTQIINQNENELIEGLKSIRDKIQEHF